MPQKSIHACVKQYNKMPTAICGADHVAIHHADLHTGQIHLLVILLLLSFS